MLHSAPQLIAIDPPLECCDPIWEAAYLRFETPAQEIRKFQRRLRQLGAKSWPRESRIVDLFCGRGNGLQALWDLGFTRLAGVDLSASLLGQCTVPAPLYICDCRRLPFESASQDVLLVQGGLHHLPTLPEDLQQVVAEAQRVLVPGGRFVAVEPWRTPFLDFVHALTRSAWLRQTWSRLEALAVMIDRERGTYEQWLSQARPIHALLTTAFDVEHCSTGWGKLSFVGRNRATVSKPNSPSRL